jgi:hypothetical protein
VCVGRQAAADVWREALCGCCDALKLILASERACLDMQRSEPVGAELRAGMDLGCRYRVLIGAAGRQVMCGKRFRQAAARARPEWAALAAGLARAAGAAASGCLLVLGVALWTRLLGVFIWPAVLAMATLACSA